MRSLLYIIGTILGLLGLGYALAHGMYVTSLATGIAVGCLLVSAYKRQQLLRFQRDQIIRENAELHKRLAEGERRLRYMRRLAENVETALIVVTPTGHIEWCNPTAQKILGDTPSVLPEAVADAIAHEKEEVNGMALSATEQKIEGHRRIIIALKDIHHLMEQRDIEAWRQLTRVLSHEILNSITPIITIVEALQTSHEGTELSEGLSVIERRCRSLAGFVESYRSLARVDEPKRTTFDAREFLSDLCHLFPQCRYVVEPEGLQLTADRTQMEQLMVNLLRNAIEADATHITIHARPQRLTIADDGQGMTPDVVEQIFTPFFSTKQQGSGIGLSLCRQIITRHGGTIQVSSHPGEGTTFEITL